MLEAICILWMIGAAPLPGQIQRSPGELALNQMAAKGTMIPAGQASFELPFIFDPSADGGEWLHVYRSAESTTVTLRNPGGTIIDAETAAGMGFAWREWTIAITADLDLDAGDDLGLVPGGIGTHMIIQFPGGQPAGTYTLVFDAGSTTVQTVVTVEFWTNSPVAAGVRTDARSYRTGDPVSVIAVVANGGDPVAGATVTGYALPTRDVTESVSVGEAVLLDKSDLGSGMSHYRYRIRLHNNTQSSSMAPPRAESPRRTSAPCLQFLDSRRCSRHLVTSEDRFRSPPRPRRSSPEQPD
ncbi:MAG: hypothetical protein LC114_21090 [Bryobacterales bacterium]|nr:hypothetical protein [Bryobacterales bacterium]